MTTTLTVLLESRSRDRGLKRYLRTTTQLANEFADGVDRASRAGERLSDRDFAIPRPRRSRVGAQAGGRRDRGSRRGSRARSRLARMDEMEASRRAAQLRRAAKVRADGEEIDRHINKAKHVELEIARERNRRSRRAARREAKTRLGPEQGVDPSAGRGGGRQLSRAADLAIAGAEFEQFGDRVQDGLTVSFSAFKDYEKAVKEVSTLTDDIPIDRIRDITTEAALEFGGLPVDQTKAFYAVVSAGATDATTAQEQLVAANKLAIGGVAEQEDAVLSVSKSVANFGGTAGEAADSMFTAVKRGQTTVSEMARALPSVAQAASSAGLSLDETNAALAVLSTRMPNAREAASGLKAAFSNLQKPTKAARKEARRLGVDFSVAGVEAAGGFEPFLESLRAAEKFDENSLAKLFDSSEARSAIGGLVDGMDDYQSVLADMESKQGAADRAFSQMSETSAQKAAQLEAQWEVLKISAGEALVPALTEIAEAFGPIIKDITTWMKENPKLAAGLMKIAVGTVVASKGVGALSSGMSMFDSVSVLASSGAGGVTKALQGITKVGPAVVSGMGRVAAALGPVGLAIAGIGLAVGALALSVRDDMQELDAELARLDQLNASSEDGGQSFSFVTEDGSEVSDEEIFLQQRRNLVADVNAKRNLFKDSNFTDVAKGIKRDQFLQAVADLRRFDEANADNLGLGFGERSDLSFFDPEDAREMIELLRENAMNTKAIAANATPEPRGPSMEAGLV